MRLRRSETRLDRTRPHLSMRGSLTHQMKGKQGQAAIGKIEEKFLALLLNLTQCENWDKVSLPGLAVASRTNVASPQGLQKQRLQKKASTCWWPGGLPVPKSSRSTETKNQWSSVRVPILSLSLSVGRDCPHANSIRWSLWKHPPRRKQKCAKNVIHFEQSCLSRCHNATIRIVRSVYEKIAAQYFF